MRIYVSGVFDLFHYGHIRLLKKCKILSSDVHLIVGIHNDRDSTSYKRKPIMNEEERYLSVKESNLADVIIYNAPIKEMEEFYNLYNIELVVHAHSPSEDEYYQKLCYNAAHKLGIFKRLDYTKGISTTELINRIKSR